MEKSSFRISVFGITLLLLICMIQAVAASTVSLEDKQVQVGSTTTMNLMLDSAPLGLSGYGVTVSVANPAVAEITNITVPSWGVPVLGGTLPATSIQFGTFDWSLFTNPGVGHVTSGATNVVLATLSLKGKSTGSTSLAIVPGEFEDIQYNSFTPDIDPGSITVNPISSSQYTITVTQGTHGTISPGTTVKAAGEGQTFTITPNSGYYVASVIVDGSSVGAVTSYTFTTIQAAHTITATFTQNPATQYMITVTQGAHGTISPGTTTKTAGESQTFTITPDSGYHIASVIVDGSSAGVVTSYTFTTIQAAHTITASFSQGGTSPYTLTVIQTSHGTISPGTTVKAAGESQTFTITPTTGYYIAAVYVDGVSVGAVTSYTFTNIQAYHDIMASFVQNPSTQFTITVTQATHGTISPGTIVKNGGESQTFTITPDSGYHVDSVTVDGTSVGAVTSYQFTSILANHAITATFGQNSASQYTITVTQATHGTISPGTTVKNGGESQTFTITPDSGYHVAAIYVDGISVGTVSSYTFTNILANHGITATFTQDTGVTYTITVTQGAHGTISPGTTVKNAGESQTFTITPDTGYHIGLVTIDGSPFDSPQTYTFTNIQAAHTIAATFTANAPQQFIITVTQGAHGTISPGTTSKNAGENQTFTITPDSGYYVASVMVDGSSVGAVTSYTFSGIQAAHTITATFSQSQTSTTQYTITVTQGTHGTISPGTTVKNGGESQTFSITPDSGYRVASVTVDGSSVGAVTSYTFSDIQAAHTITASFAQGSTMRYTITVIQTSHGTISPGTTSKNAGESQTFTMTPEAGYHVASVMVDGSSVGAVTSYTFSNIQSNHDILANFAVNTGPVYTIAVTQGAHGTISPGTTVKSSGESQTFTITPDSGYYVISVIVDGISAGAVTSYTFSGIQADHSITATFGQSPSTTGNVYLTSTPSGALVFIDGVSYGTTPNLFILSTGSHQILLRASGYQDTTVTVNVVQGQTLFVPVTLTTGSSTPTQTPTSYIIVPVTNPTFSFPTQPQAPTYPFGFNSIIPVFGSVVNQISIFGMNLQF